MRRLVPVLLAVFLAACAPSQALPTPPPPTALDVAAAPSPTTVAARPTDAPSPPTAQATPVQAPPTAAPTGGALTPGPSPRTSEGSGAVTPSASARAGEGSAARTPAAPLPAGAVLFFETVDGSVWAAAADGSSARALTEPLLTTTAPNLLFSSGTPEPRTTPPPGPFRSSTLRWVPSPTGQEVAVIRGDGLVAGPGGRPTANLLVIDTQGGVRMQMSLLRGNETTADFAAPERRARLMTLLLQSPPAWSPDGRQIAVVSDHEGQPDLYVVSVADGKVTRVTQDAATEVGPTWSPDGVWLAYEAGADVDVGLYVVKAEGGDKARRLAAGETAPHALNGLAVTRGGALWIGADTLVWPSRNPQPPQCGVSLRRITLDGKDDTLVCTAAASSGERPALHWNAARKRLAFVPPQQAGPTAGAAATPFPLLTPGAPFQGFWVYNADEKKAGQAVTGRVLSLAWPPNGDLGIAYAGSDGANVTLYWRHDAADNKLLTLAAPAAADPVWAPDGKRLAFADRVVTTEGQEVARLPGERPRAVTWTTAGLLYATDARSGVTRLGLWDGANTHTVAESVLLGSVRVGIAP